MSIMKDPDGIVLEFQLLWLSFKERKYFALQPI